MALSAADLRDPRYLVALGFGSGLAPRAPGTFGTLAAIPFFLVLSQLDWLAYLAVVGVAFAAGVWLCDVVARDMAVKDPGAIVWDEFVGLWVALAFLPTPWWWLLVGVLLFRLFDIWKPWPVSFLDRRVPGGLGIMLDDLAAGLMALAALQLLNLGWLWLAG